MTVNPPKTSYGIEQLDDILDDLFSHELLNTLLPGLFLFILNYIAFQKIGVQTLVWQNQAKAGGLRPKYLSDKL